MSAMGSAGPRPDSEHDGVVWDMVFPLIPSMGNGFDKLARFAGAGFDMVSLTIANDFETASSALARVAAVRRQLQDASNHYVLVEAADDVLRTKRERKLAVGLHFSGTGMFERNLDLVESFYALGVRNAQLTFNAANAVGSGCGETVDGGLTVYGRKVVREMERVGMLVDLSHVGYRTSMDALAMAERPMVFTHGCAHALCAHYRNVRDDQAKAVAATGGLIGVSCSNGYLGVERSSVDAVVRHIDHFAGLLGAAHVALGLDIVFDEAALNDWVRAQPDWPEGRTPDWPGFNYMQPEAVGGLADALRARGYVQEDIAGILGGNWLRVCRAVWR